MVAWVTVHVFMNIGVVDGNISRGNCLCFGNSADASPILASLGKFTTDSDTLDCTIY